MADLREAAELELPSECFFFFRLRLLALGIRAKEEDLAIVCVFFKRLTIKLNSSLVRPSLASKSDNVSWRVM